MDVHPIVLLPSQNFLKRIRIRSLLSTSFRFYWQHKSADITFIYLSLSPTFMAIYNMSSYATMLTGPKPCFPLEETATTSLVSSLVAGYRRKGRPRRLQHTCLGGEPAKRSHIHRRKVFHSTCHSVGDRKSVV